MATSILCPSPMKRFWTLQEAVMTEKTSKYGLTLDAEATKSVQTLYDIESTLVSEALAQAAKDAESPQSKVVQNRVSRTFRASFLIYATTA